MDKNNGQTVLVEFKTSYLDPGEANRQVQWYIDSLRLSGVSIVPPQKKTPVGAGDGRTFIVDAVPYVKPRAKTDMAKRLRDIAEDPMWMNHCEVSKSTLLAAAYEIDRYYEGMVNWKTTAEAKDATIAELRAPLARRDWRGEAKPVTYPPCKGMNCGVIDGISHSMECQAGYAAAIAGGYFVKKPAVSAQTGMPAAMVDTSSISLDDDFHKKAMAMRNAFGLNPQDPYRAMITHIDAHTARAVAEALEGQRADVESWREVILGECAAICDAEAANCSASGERYGADAAQRCAAEIRALLATEAKDCKQLDCAEFENRLFDILKKETQVSISTIEKIIAQIIALPRLPQLDSERDPALDKALAAVTAAVEVNDNDTLASLLQDSHVVWTATGSWSQPTSVTLGDLRAIAAAAHRQGGLSDEHLAHP